jgi:site-specific recombinase XerD
MPALHTPLSVGVTLPTVRDTLGHASLATAGRYLHARPNDSAGVHLAAI